MAAPTIVYGGSSDYDVNNPDSVAGLSWASGDTILVLGMAEDNQYTIADPTNANLSFSPLSGLPTNTSSSCKGYGWSAVAGSPQSAQTVSSSNAGGTGRGISVWVISGTDGLTVVTPVISTAKTISVARGGDNSGVVTCFGDYSADADVTVDPTPATNGSVRFTHQASGLYSSFVCDWGDQGGAGTTSYGIANASGTGLITKVAIEVLGAAGGPVTGQAELAATALVAAVGTKIAMPTVVRSNLHFV